MAVDSGVPTEEVFPSSTVWMNDLSCFLARPPNPSLSLASSMGGAYFLVQGNASANSPSPGRDSNGRSVTARMAQFTAKLLVSGLRISLLPPEFQLELVYLLCVTDALAGDQLSVVHKDSLWSNGPDTEDEIQQFRELSSTAIGAVIADAGNWRGWDMSGDSLVERLVSFMIQEARGSSPGAFYTAKALASLFQALVKAHGPFPKLEDWLVSLGIMRVAPDTMFVTSAFLAGFGDTLASSKLVTTLCTRLISEIPGFPPGSPRTLASLVLLNLCLDVYESGQVPVETRKQVLALQQITRWADTPQEMGYQLAAETCKAIARLLPGVKDTYGPYWEKIVVYCIRLWKRAADDKVNQRLPYIYASLKLMQALHAEHDANDDLEEALASHGEEESAALITLLGLPSEGSATLPSQLVDAVLGRAVSKIPHAHLADLGEIYVSVASESRDIQRAAFGLLHQALPAAQEEINVAVVMDKKGKPLPRLRRHEADRSSRQSPG